MNLVVDRNTNEILRKLPPFVRGILQIGEITYVMIPTPKGENSCHVCDIYNYCYQTLRVGLPCLTGDVSDDYYFRRLSDFMKEEPQQGTPL